MERVSEYLFKGVFVKGYYGDVFNEGDVENVMLRYNLLFESVLMVFFG